MTLVSRQREETDQLSCSKSRLKIFSAAIVLLVIVSVGYIVTNVTVDGHKRSASKPSKSRSIQCENPLTHSLRRILLAINFNHPYYRSLDILLLHYKDIFPNYVICGPVRDPRKKYNIIVVKHPLKQRGFYGFECLPEAIKRNPGYDGYLYINDDMLINWWNLLELDKTKIWFGCDIKFENSIPVGNPPHNNWWKRADSAVQCTKAFNYVYDNLATGWMKEIYRKNSDGQKICFSCWSDIFYIPGHLSFFFLRFGDIFYQNKVFLEASVPTIMAFLDERKSYIRLRGKYLPDKYAATVNYFDGSLESPLWQEYDRKLVFTHPYKLFGKKIYANTNIKNYKRIMVNASQKIIKERCIDSVLKDTEWDNF